MVIEGERKEVGVEKEDEKEDERDAATGLSSRIREGTGRRLSLDEEPDVEAGSNVFNCTLLVHVG